MIGALVRRAAAKPARPLRRALATQRMRSWAPYTRLFVVGEGRNWALDEEARHVRATARGLGYELGPEAWAGAARGQSVFLTSHFALATGAWFGRRLRLGVSYFHGRPGTPGYPEFDRVYQALRQHAGEVARVQVTHAEMHELALAAGIPPERIFRIPIPVDLESFPFVTPELRTSSRVRLGLPGSAFVVASFQKDGVGWGKGLQPKTIKGPDVLLETLAVLQRHVPELVVQLSGPARGYVCAGLERLGIPYRHVRVGTLRELAGAYHAADAYLVASRQEGGPKAVLEAMATGTPLVTTRVGQATDLVTDGRDGLLAEVEDAEGLAAALLSLHDDPARAATLRHAGRAVAEANSTTAVAARWAALLDGLVERAPAA